MQLGPFVIFFIFLGLKLSHVVDWSWWWVASPLLIGSFLIGSFLAVSVIFITKTRNRIHRQQQAHRVNFKDWDAFVR